MRARVIKTISYFRWDADSLFRDRDFLLLWLSQTLTAIAASVFGIAIAILANVEGLGSNYENSAFGVALVLLFTNLPGLVFSLVAGVMADWFDRKTIMFISSLIRFGLAMTFVVFTGWDSAVVAYSIVFLKSGITQVYMPAQASVIPDIIKKKNILLANSIFNLTNYATYILGVVGAGALIRIFGERHSFTVLGVMFLIGALVIPLIRVPQRKVHIDFSEFIKVVTEFIASVKEGISYIWEGKIQKFAMIHNFITTSVLFIIITVIFKLAKFLIGIDARDVGLVTMAPLALGIFFSIIYLNIVGAKAKRAALIHNGVIVAFFAFLIFTILTFLRYNDYRLGETLMGLNFDFVIWAGVITSLGLVGIAFPLLIIPAQTLIHEDTRHDIRGRVFGVWFAVNQALATLPAVFVGLMADSSVGMPRVTTLLTIFVLLYSIILIPFRNIA